MGGYNIGELFGALNLDDSQFTEALRRAGGASRILQLEVDKLEGNLGNLLVAMQKAGFNASALAGDIANDIGKTQSLNDVTKEYIALLDQVKQRVQALGIGTDAIRIEREKDSLKRQKEMAQQLILNAEGESRLEKQATNEHVANQNQRAAGEKRAADEHISLANQIAAGDQRMANERVQQANQYAEAEYRASRAIIDAQSAIQQAERRRFEEHRRLMQLSSGLTTVGVAIGGVGAAGIGGELFAASEAAHFQDAMAKSIAIIGDVSSALRDQLANAARQAAKETGLAAKDIALDFGVLAKGGRTAADSVGSIGTFTKYAVATNTELHDSTKQILTVMEALGLEVSETKRVTDAFTVANSLARGSVDTLATALEGKGGAALRNSKATLEQSLAITVAFAKAGIEGGTAQTAMAQLVNRFTEAVKSHGETLIDVAGKQKKWRDIVYDSHGEVRSFLAIIGDLNVAFKNRSAEEVNKAFSDIGLGSVRAINSLKPLLGSSGLLAELEKAFLNAGDASQKAFDTQMQSPLKQLEVLHRKLDDLAITLGIPVVTALESLAKALGGPLKAVTELVGWFSTLNPSVQTFIALVGLLGSATLVGSGGMLVMAGTAVRLAADLKLLTGVNTFGALATGLSSLGAAGLIAAAGLAAYLAVKKLVIDPADAKRARDNKKFGMPTGIDAHGELVPGGSAEDVSKSGATLAAKFGDGFGGQWDTTRKAIEEKLKGLAAMVKEYASGSLTTDPNKAGQERQRLFSNLGLTDFQTTIKQLKADLAEAMNLGILNPEQIAAAQAGIEKMETAYAEFGKSVKTSLLQATNTVGTRTLLAEFDEIKAEAQDALNTAIRIRLALAKGTTGHPENEIAPIPVDTIGEQGPKSLKYWEDMELAIARVSDELRKFQAIGIKDGTTRGLGPDAELQRIEAYAKFHGVNIISQHDLDAQAAYAKEVLQQVYDFQKNGGYAAAQTVASAQIAFIEAQARAMHVSAQDYAKSIGQDYNALRHQIEDTVKAGNSALARSITEIGTGLRRIMGDISNGLADLLPIFASAGASPIDNLTKSFRGAYEQLSAYANPKQALTELVASIQNAGSQAQANAIAVKYFGTTSGPLLAKELRDGTLAAKDISKAIDGATVSTQAYDSASTNSISKVTALWQKAVKDIVALIAKVLIEQGLKALIDWMFKVGTSSSKMADDIVAAVKKIAQWIGLISKPGTAAVGAISTAANTATAAASTVDDSIETVNAGVKAGSTAAGTAGSAASSAAGFAGQAATAWIGAISGAITAVSSVIGNFQMSHMNTSLGRIEVSTRGSLNEALNLRRDAWDQHNALSDRLGEIWNSITGGFGANFARLGDIWNAIQHMSGGGSVAYATGSSNTTVSGAGSFVLSGPITIIASDPKELIRQLKALRIVQGL